MDDALFDLPTQPALLPAERAVRTVDSTVENPIARVILDTPFSWPDRDYDYLVPEKLAEAAVPGVRVRVQFGAKRLTGFLRERGTTTDATSLKPLLGVLGEPVVTPELFDLADRIAARNVCSRHDVLRGAVPPRHARAEKAITALGQASFAHIEAPEPSPLGGLDLTAGTELLVPAGRSTWEAVAWSAQAALAAGSAVLIVVPTSLEVDRARAAISDRLPGEPIALIEAGTSPETRYRHFLSAKTGRARIVLGTRAAAFAPVDAGLLIVVDEQNDAMRDKRSPYMWADEVLRMRGEGRALLRFSFPPRIHRSRPRMVAGGVWPTVTRAEQWAGDQRGLLPPAAFATIRRGLETGPVIVSAPRAGYVPALACQRCGKKAVCQQCGTSLAVPTPGTPASCGTCGSSTWRCACGSSDLRAVARGSTRVAQELAAAFPGVGVESVRSAAQDSTLPIVIATPGAEPDREFAAGVILDAGSRLASLSLDAEIEAVGRWARVASRVSQHVLLTGGVPPHLAEALATRSIDFIEPLVEEREALGQPPFHRWFAISGQRADVQRLLGGIAARLEGEAPPEQGIAALLTGGGRQVFAAGIHIVGPVEDAEGVTLHLHEEAPAERLAGVLRATLQDLGQMAVRIEADPII
ncbi:hypothetical protein EJO69_02380 [Flaviflexus salsibiostraticola]|uniref:Primosomal protein N' 3' DNA-binding domain-containing protein n=1 Tax=Flaviflexus salsibiostraticola TaxID=1282737 RepID=A0A3Q8WSK0_9ACTO|nr:hypothetical protein [Flaviflexus salsibiostraticola]AZN29275.1 hypothetical protein EJO69_02380 [Flaviflexus salsibiostraticola]